MNQPLKWNPAFGFTPNVKKPQYSVPEFKALTPTTWTHLISNDPYNYLLPADQQDPNYRDDNEAYHRNGIKMYSQPTGKEPIYGQEYNPLAPIMANNDKLTGKGMEVLSDTRIQYGKFIDDKWLMRPVSTYPIPPFITDFVGGGNLLR